MADEDKPQREFDPKRDLAPITTGTKSNQALKGENDPTYSNQPGNGWQKWLEKKEKEREKKKKKGK